MAGIVIIGPAHPLRGGGIVSFNQRLAYAFQEAGQACEIWSFSLQYPGFLFPGKSQFVNTPPPTGLTIRTLINSINPLNWIKVGLQLRKKNPELIIVRFWIPFMGPCLGTILRLINNKKTKVICIADNVIPHEKRPGDRLFTHYFIKSCDGFVTMSKSVLKDLQLFAPTKPAKLTVHPLYDQFGPQHPQEFAREKLGLNSQDKIILFFGFIRPYKGLDLLLAAMQMQQIRSLNIKLLIAGEFYENEVHYRQLIQDYQLQDQVILRTHFIPDEQVGFYLSAADVVVQPYKTATQSGVTPLAYYFKKPMIVTNVGGLPEMVPHEKAGLVCEPNPEAIAKSIESFYNKGAAYFASGILEERRKYEWSTMIETLFTLHKEIN
ncbi:MAG: glycosyltransferase [Bacteroidetes bacterium]|nr:glycosyltransferase [Bacteroidota bacterium]